jgi:deoxyribose-phosphate aldolase
MNLTVKELASKIDHTLLKADANASAIEQLCAEAAEYNLFSVCINPCWIKKSSELLKNTKVKICTVIGFPLGANTAQLKAEETRQAVYLGADEIDMVLNIGAVKSSDFIKAEEDIAAVVGAASKRTVKVILETCFLTDDEIIKACRICEDAGADFIKTSTGFGSGGAEERHIKLIKANISSRTKIKASGGIKTLETALLMLEAGADRLGCSSSVPILKALAAGL